MSAVGTKVALEIAIEQRAHAGGKHERGQEILVQAAAADNVEILVADRQSAHRRQRKLDAIGQFFSFEKCGRSRASPCRCVTQSFL